MHTYEETQQIFEIGRRAPCPENIEVFNQILVDQESHQAWLSNPRNRFCIYRARGLALNNAASLRLVSPSGELYTSGVLDFEEILNHLEIYVEASGREIYGRIMALYIIGRNDEASAAIGQFAANPRLLHDLTLEQLRNLRDLSMQNINPVLALLMPYNQNRVIPVNFHTASR